MLCDHADACLRWPRCGGESLAGVRPWLCGVPSSPAHRLFPMRERLGERVRAVLLAAEITERAPLCFSLIVAVALDQVIASRVAGSA